jgi:hypothetical protein
MQTYKILVYKRTTMQGLDRGMWVHSFTLTAMEKQHINKMMFRRTSNGSGIVFDIKYHCDIRMKFCQIEYIDVRFVPTPWAQILCIKNVCY